MTDPEINWLLMKVTLDSANAALSTVAAKLGVPESSIDPKFGIVAVDQRKQTFAVQVDAAIFETGSPFGPKSDRKKGPFANPPIAPFGKP